MSEETKFCDMVDCPERALVLISDGRNVCGLHAVGYQRDLADRMNRDGVTLH